MAKNRELSQLGSLIVVDTNGNIGIATPADTTPNVGIGTDNPQFKLDVAGDINFSGLLRQDGSTPCGGNHPRRPERRAP